MKEKKKILSPYKRKVHIGDQEWTYQIERAKIGPEGYLKVCNPQRTKKYTINLPEVGKSFALEDFEYCPEEYDGDGSDLYSVAITPKVVKDLILKNIISKN